MFPHHTQFVLYALASFPYHPQQLLCSSCFCRCILPPLLLLLRSPSPSTRSSRLAKSSSKLPVNSRSGKHFTSLAQNSRAIYHTLSNTLKTSRNSVLYITNAMSTIFIHTQPFNYTSFLIHTRGIFSRMFDRMRIISGVV